MKTSSDSSASSAASPSSHGFIASKTGKKYYPADAQAAQKIKEENRVFFQTAEEAEKAGYGA